MVERDGGGDIGGQEAINEAVVEGNAVFICRPFSSREDTGHGNGKSVVLETHVLSREGKRRQSRGGHVRPNFGCGVQAGSTEELSKVGKTLCPRHDL